ncbi:hypothetical protein JZ751_014193 [Albula glossodonta]|uniref:Uncharacterized protein n=1 Tax=Albula glossodonta TaxID=121402 RepID=A0A8T2NST0_9TELE|nr:hypothetical protein JZ751_014193 [Albula glossodonta]
MRYIARENCSRVSFPVCLVSANVLEIATPKHLATPMTPTVNHIWGDERGRQSGGHRLLLQGTVHKVHGLDEKAERGSTSRQEEQGRTHEFGGSDGEAETGDADIISILGTGHQPKRHKKALQGNRSGRWHLGALTSSRKGQLQWGLLSLCFQGPPVTHCDIIMLFRDCSSPQEQGALRDHYNELFHLGFQHMVHCRRPELLG